MTTPGHFRMHPKIVVLDFLICIDEKPTHLIEVKTSEEDPSKGFAHFSAFLPQARQIQVVKSLKREKTFPSGLEVRSLLPWLAHLNLRPSE